MFDRFKRSFELVRASAQVLRRDTHLMLFPLISGLAFVLVIAAFLLPLFGLRAFDGIGRPGLYSVGFLCYVVEYFVIFYFNAALVGAVMIRLDGGRPTLGDGLRIANGRIAAILGYAVISATIGVILRVIQERVGFVGRLIAGVLGASWTVASFLVVPVIVMRDRGAVESISDSAALLKRTWGENLIGHAGVNTVFAVIYFGLAMAVAGAAVLLGQAAAMLSPAVFVAFAIAAVLAFLACVLVHSTLTGIYSAVLYRYATDGSGAPGFDGGLLDSAFRRKS